MGRWTASQQSRQQAGRLSSWHDGRPATRQDFTVKKRPKHCIGETSEHFLSLAGRSTIGALNIPESRADAGLRAAMPLPVSGAQVEKANRALAMPTTVVAVLAGVLAVEVAEDWLEYLHHGRSGHDAHTDYRDLVEHGSLAP
jgi:hypothetical protein